MAQAIVFIDIDGEALGHHRFLLQSMIRTGTRGDV
jgi:hypothetical protein